MTARMVLALATALFSLAGRTDTINTNELGQLQLEYTAAVASNRYPGRPLAALTSYRPGESVSVISYPRVQQLRYLLPAGTEVRPGQALAVLSGPEVTHFLTEFELTGRRLALAESRYRANEDLYRRKAIDETRWMAISEAYYALKLEHEHLHHFHQLLRPGSSESDGVTLLSPAGGTLWYAPQEGGLPAGGELLRIIPVDAMRLKVAVPVASRSGLVALSKDQCELEISSTDTVVDAFRVTAWSEPLTDDCPFLAGQRLMVTPLYRGDSVRIPAQALMQFQGSSAVLVHQQGQLVPTPVEVLGSTADAYFVRSDTPLADRELLSSSVSAVQGILLGLGGE